MWLDVEALADLEHHRPLLVQDLPEIGLVTRAFIDAELVVDLRHALGLAGLDHEIGELRHDRLRSAGGHRAAEHPGGLVGQTLLVERRDVGQLLNALERRHGDDLDRALLQEGKLRGVAAGRCLQAGAACLPARRGSPPPPPSCSPRSPAGRARTTRIRRRRGRDVAQTAGRIGADDLDRLGGQGVRDGRRRQGRPTIEAAP